MPVEPLAEPVQGEAWLEIIQRLVRAFVNYEAVESVGHQQVCPLLEDFRIGAPGIPCLGEGLRGDIFLPVEMGYGGGLPAVGARGSDSEDIGRIARPHCRHRDGGVLLDPHSIGDKSSHKFMGLGVTLETVFFQDLGKKVIMIDCDKFRNGPAEIPQEPVRRFRRLYHIAGQGRKPFQQVVAANFPEGFEHLRGPVQASGLPAVEHQIVDALLAHQAPCGILVHRDVVLDIVPDSVCIKFVDLETGSLRRGRAVLVACQ